MHRGNYSTIWLMFVNTKAMDGLVFNDLIDSEGVSSKPYIGAWANALLKADTITDALRLAPSGLSKMEFEIVFIDKIENVESLAEYGELKAEVLEDSNCLLKSNFVFKISDAIFPYSLPA